MDFKECFHEHESTKTIAGYYKVLELTYKYTKLFTYHFFVFIFGFPFAISFALLNGFIYFIHVWIFGPLAKITLLWVYALIPVLVSPIAAYMRPLVDVHARVFRQIRIHLSGPTLKYSTRERSNV